MTKLLKNTLISKLSAIDYYVLEDKKYNDIGFYFVKPINNFFLCISFNKLRLLDTGMITYNYYLSKVIIQNHSFFPHIAFGGPGKFLTNEDRSKILPKEYTGEKIKVCAWHFSSLNDIDNILMSIIITEQRFLSQQNLFNLVDTNPSVNSDLLEIKTCIKMFDSSEYTRYNNYNCIPNKPKNKFVPIQYYQVAEIFFNKNNLPLFQTNVEVLGLATYWHREKIKLLVV